ncbi:MAG: GNAT family N-acetyltransferase, partial [Elusimicrobiales bacterium]|nr:GNAT family N-acetyltransferase [Elusimicrobiales bacterium]
FTVAPKYRRKNIGSKLLSFIVELLIKRGIKWIGLICEKGTENFYTKNGFKYVEGMKFLRYETKKNK